MNVLIIQENGRHEKNRKFRECFSLQRAFNKLNHDCEIWGLGHDNFEKTPDFNKYDLIFNLENYDSINWLPNLSKTTHPIKLLWSIDAHWIGDEKFEKTFYEGKYNYLLHSTKDFVKKDYHRWFPNAYDDDLIYNMKIQKNAKVGFCGNFVNRKEILLELQQKFNLKLDIFVIGEEMVKAINSYGCHFNLNIANDLNYRSFETIGCGTLLLTNYNPFYEELNFINEKNCLMYKNKNQLFEYLHNIEFFINNTEIAKNGENLSKEHTYKKRIEKILNEI